MYTSFMQMICMELDLHTVKYLEVCVLACKQVYSALATNDERKIAGV